MLTASAWSSLPVAIARQMTTMCRLQVHPAVHTVSDAAGACTSVVRTGATQARMHGKSPCCRLCILAVSSAVRRVYIMARLLSTAGSDTAGRAFAGKYQHTGAAGRLDCAAVQRLHTGSRRSFCAGLLSGRHRRDADGNFRQARWVTGISCILLAQCCIASTPSCIAAPFRVFSSSQADVATI